MTATSALCVSTAPEKLLSVAQHLPVTQWDLTFLHVSLKPKFHAATSTYKNAQPHLLTAQSPIKNLERLSKKEKKIW